MDALKITLLDTMQSFHIFCEKYKLEYFIIGGTLLGAIRHEGFIPWDDDVDVVMPRADYEKLLSLQSNFEQPLELKTLTSESGFKSRIAKLTNNDFRVEVGEQKMNTTGIWVDIFPLDYTFSNIYLRKHHFLQISSLKLLTALKYNLVNIKKLPAKKRYKRYLLKYIAKGTSITMLNRVCNVVEKYPSTIFKNKNHYANLYGAWGIKEVAPVHVFLEKKLYKFEDKYFWGPLNYDFWLEKVYGDYMTLPPEEKRVSPHITKSLSL